MPQNNTTWNILVYQMRREGGVGEPDILKISDNEYYDRTKRRMIDRGCEIIMEVRDLPYERLGEFEGNVKKALRGREEERWERLASLVTGWAG